MTAHPTDRQIASFRARSLAPGELLALEQHFETCDACRGRLRAHAAAISGHRNELAEHLDREDLVLCAEGFPGAEVQRHLLECDTCREEVDDLKRFRSDLKSTPHAIALKPSRRRLARWPAVAAIAGGLLLVAGIAYWTIQQRPRIAVKDSPKPAEAAVPLDQQLAVQLALARHTFERASILDALASPPGPLPGAPPAAARFDLAAPLGTTVLTARPIFRWQPTPGATRYTVAVFDPALHKIAESSALATAEWQPETALPRGAVLYWQVTATVAGHSLHAPQPPVSEARFEILPEETVAQIDSARRDHPGNHMLLAVLLARAGALDDAAKELDAVPQDPGVAALRESLAAMRKPKL